MIPKLLSLRNFLSYRDATLDFSGLHSACICGPNGSGKSSLLEAMAWAVWGMSRAGAEDDIIHVGEMEARVDFTFVSQGQIYRVIRSRRRHQTTSLEFQIATNPQEEKYLYRSLTERGIRGTQQKILEAIKLDYDTFINSAYLRQGKADEFMLKRPVERKDVLVTLLKLNQYDKLSEQAKEFSKQFKAKIDFLEVNVEKIELQLQEKGDILNQQFAWQKRLEESQEKQRQDQEILQQFQTQQHQRQTWEKLLFGQQQHYHRLSQEYQRLEQELLTTQAEKEQLHSLLEQREEIEQGKRHFQDLQNLDESFSVKFQEQQKALSQRQELQEKQRQNVSELQTKIQQLQARWESWEQQKREQEEILGKLPEIEAGLVQLKKVRTRLTELEELQLKVTPLHQQRQQLSQQLDRARTRITDRLDELSLSIRNLQENQEKSRPIFTEELAEISQHLTDLDKKRVYQNRVYEKGQERHHFWEKLSASKRDYESRLADLEKKIQLLGNPQSLELEKQNVPVCPLCDRPLDEHHWNLVMEKQKTQHQELLDQLWLIREQLTLSEKEIGVLRQEFRQLENELLPYQDLREKRVHIQSQLTTLDGELLHLQKMQEEAVNIQKLLESGNYATDLLSELQKIEEQIKSLNYNEEIHALTRTEEKNLRGAEIRFAEMKTAQNKLNKIAEQIPELEEKMILLQTNLEEEKMNSSLQKMIQKIDNDLIEIGYDLEKHNQIRQELRHHQFWLTRGENLHQAEQKFPQLEERIKELQNRREILGQDVKIAHSEVLTLKSQLEETPDPSEKIKELEKQINTQRQVLDQELGKLGQIQQKLQHLDQLENQLLEQKEEISSTRCQYRIYQELAQAFGKNGIQALMIENVLPQLEAETNQILSRLSANQLHVQFITQKAKKTAKSSKKEPKLIETLDILIADAQGTRAYETYSGGEAFRINFSIRLALAKLLAQRAGTALQLLIIDEGFGTQDGDGCDRLIAAINAISADFSCILTVTHIPHLKEAFQARVEVTKTPQGSRINLSV